LYAYAWTADRIRRFRKNRQLLRMLTELRPNVDNVDLDRAEEGVDRLLKQSTEVFASIDITMKKRQ
jgi:uncharacterized protein HemY